MTGDGERVQSGHGAGGRLTRDLVEAVFLRRLRNPALDALGDAALLPPVEGPLAFATDGFVVDPLEFPGGDIGSLCVNGTVNDLAVSGAVPLWLSAAFILEEGLPFAALERIAGSMARAGGEAGVGVVAGDTKVVGRGHGDGIYVATAGVGRVREGAPPGTGALRPGDAILVSGPVGDHGAVVAAVRSGITVEEALASDCAPVHGLVEALYAAGVRPLFMRDPTRGGLATVLAEAARASGLTAEVREEDLPVREPVRAVCGILGLDPLYLACEGRVVAVVRPGEAGAALRALRSAPGGGEAAVAGEMRERRGGPVVLRTPFGGGRVYDLLAADPLPRIC